MTTPYDVDAQGENVYFKDSASLVFNNRIVAILIAIGILLYQQESLGNVAPLYKYALISGSNFLATYSQYDALKYVSFPTQTLGKCGKMIAVMITGSFINQKTYSLNEYGIAAGITLGCVIFMMGGNIASKRTDHSDSVYGLVLMGVYLFSDSFTSTFQEKLFKDYKISTYNQMLYVNASSAAMSIFVLIGQVKSSMLTAGRACHCTQDVRHLSRPVP